MAAPRTREILHILDSLETIQPWTQSRLIALLALEDTFSELQIDPLTLQEHQRQPRNPRVVGAMTATQAVTRTLVFTADRSDLQSIRDSAQCIRFDGRIAEVLVSAYSALVSSKDLLFDLMEQTPEFFSLLFDLWLHFPGYTSTSRRFEPLAMHLFSFVSSAVMLLTVYPDADDDTVLRAHSTAVREAMLVTRMRPKRMYKRAVQYMQYCRNAGNTLVYGLRTLTFLIKGALAIPCHSRQTIHLLVELLRETNRGTDEEAADATGADACALLEEIWLTDEGHRSLIWALQKGVLHLLMELNVRTSGRITHILSYVCKRSIFLPVARTLGEVSPQSSFRFAKMHSEVNGTDVDIQYRERLKVLDSLLPEKLCGNDECGYVLIDEQRQMKACRCFRIRYCSLDCQQAHWPVHRSTCDYRTFPRFIMRLGELRPIEIHYAASLTLLYLKRVGSAIVSEIDAHLARLADPSEKRIFVVKIDFLNEVLPRHEINAFTTEDVSVMNSHISPSTNIPRSLVQVVAILGRIGGTMTAIVATPDVTVEIFRRRPSMATESSLHLFVRGSSSCTSLVAAAQLYTVQPVSVTSGSISTFISMCTASKRPSTQDRVSSRSESPCDCMLTDSWISTSHEMMKAWRSLYEEGWVQKCRTFHISQQRQNMQDGIVRVRDIVRAWHQHELENEVAHDLQQPLWGSQRRWILLCRRVFFWQTKPDAGEETLLYLRAHAPKRESALLERPVVIGCAQIFKNEADELWR
ncbi:hypothetical protein EV714DRAFT_283796 [Schizophyllum commune]